jgi:hypothetical protein
MHPPYRLTVRLENHLYISAISPAPSLHTALLPPKRNSASTAFPLAKYHVQFSHHLAENKTKTQIKPTKE